MTDQFEQKISHLENKVNALENENILNNSHASPDNYVDLLKNSQNKLSFWNKFFK